MNHDFELFFKANERRIHFQIHNLSIKGDWYSEFYTEGIFALWQAYRDFDPTQGRLGTYLNYRIRYRLIDLIRKKEREHAREQAYQAQQKIEHTDGNYRRHENQSLVPLPTLKVKDTSIWHDIRSQLTENQWKWVKYISIDEMNRKERMENENDTANAVKGWRREVRKKQRNKKKKEKITDILEDLTSRLSLQTKNISTNICF